MTILMFVSDKSESTSLLIPGTTGGRNGALKVVGPALCVSHRPEFHGEHLL